MTNKIPIYQPHSVLQLLQLLQDDHVKKYVTVTLGEEAYKQLAGLQEEFQLTPPAGADFDDSAALEGYQIPPDIKRGVRKFADRLPRQQSTHSI